MTPGQFPELNQIEQSPFPGPSAGPCPCLKRLAGNAETLQCVAGCASGGRPSKTGSRLGKDRSTGLAQSIFGPANHLQTA